MREIIIPNKSANEIMEMVRELRQQGLVQGRDFDFKYQPPVWDDFSGHEVHTKHTVFYFHTEKYATFYHLKWS